MTQQLYSGGLREGSVHPSAPGLGVDAGSGS